MEMVPVRSDANGMATSLESKMKIDPILSTETCIFRIPSILKRHNETAYVPNAFSIGPFHHGKDSLKDGEKIKLKYLEGLVTRRGAAALREWINAIKKVEKRARECYSGGIGMSEDDFVEMLVLDGCFIIELLRKDANVVPKDNDPVFTMSCMLQFLYQDLILLENQLPWFVLELLFSSTGESSENESLLQLALAFFDNIFTSEVNKIDVKLFVNQDIKHILDFLRLSLVLPLPSTEPEPSKGAATTPEKEQQPANSDGNQQPVVLEPLPSATIMAESGIKFLKVVSGSILDVKFAGGKLEMPSLLIQETLEPAFRNLISYEQCYPNCLPRVTCYAMILDNLINTTEDIDQLAKKGILVNWLNPQDATHFFQKLYQDAYVKDLYYQNLSDQVKKYRNRLWPRWRAFYIRNYFGKPWAIVSQVVAAVLLVLTFLQTMSSMKPDKKTCICLKTVSRIR